MQKLVFTNSLGESVDLTKAPFGITNWKGLDNTKLTWQTQQVPNHDGSVFIDALMNDRDLSFTVAVQDNNNLSLRYQLKYELIQKLNPKLGEGYLVYTNDYLSRRIKVVPQIPLFANKNSNDRGTLKASVVFTANDPYWEDVEETTVELESGVNYIQNNGDIKINLKALFKGNAENPSIENMTTNEKIEIAKTMDKSILINTGFGTKSIKEIDSVYDLATYGNGFYCSLVVNNILYLFGDNGVIFKTSDSVDYEKYAISINARFKSVAYSESLQLFCAGIGNDLYISTDAKSWELVANEAINKIVYNDNLELFIAAGPNKILTSADGETWQTYAVDSVMYDIAFSSSKVCVVGASNTIYYSNDAVTWTKKVLTNTCTLMSVAYSPQLNYFIAGGFNGTTNVYAKSSNLTTWTETTNTINTMGYRFYWVEKDFCFYLIGRSYIWKTIDCENFVKLRSIGNLSFTDFLLFEKTKLYYILGDNGWDGQISYTTKDFGKLDVLLYGWGNIDLNGIAYSEEKDIYCAVYNSGVLLTSDFTSWKTKTIPKEAGSNPVLKSIIYVSEKKKFFAVGTEFSGYSEDGENWTKTNDTHIAFTQIIYVSHYGKFFAVGKYNNFSTIYESEDCLTWTRTTSTGINATKGIAFSENINLLVASCNGGYIRLSYDAENWEDLQIISYSANWRDVAYSKDLNLFIGISALSGSSSIYSSFDGRNWTQRKTDIPSVLNTVKYIESEKKFYTVGEKGAVYSSTNGIDFVEETAINVPISLKDITDGKQVAICGSAGIIFANTKKDGANIINSISSNSSMSLYLDKGQNVLNISNESGLLYSTLTYRQRYIGV